MFTLNCTFIGINLWHWFYQTYCSCWIFNCIWITEKR